MTTLNEQLKQLQEQQAGAQTQQPAPAPQTQEVAQPQPQTQTVAQMAQQNVQSVQPVQQVQPTQQPQQSMAEQDLNAILNQAKTIDLSANQENEPLNFGDLPAGNHVVRVLSAKLTVDNKQRNVFRILMKEETTNVAFSATTYITSPDGKDYSRSVAILNDTLEKLGLDTTSWETIVSETQEKLKGKLVQVEAKRNDQGFMNYSIKTIVG